MTAIQGHAGLLLSSSIQYFDSGKKGLDIVLSNGNKTAISTSGGSWESVFAVIGKSVGTNLYLEFLFTSTGSSFTFFGLGNAASPINSFCGSDANGWGLAANNTRYHSGVNQGSWATVSNNQVVGIALSSTGSVYGAVNNAWVGGGSPGAGATALFSGLSGIIFPIVSINLSGMSVTLRISSTDFSYTPPSGYVSWSGL